MATGMGIHWGAPVSETDPVTKRMDYFGPMVNRASRISSVADGGQITVSADFIAEIQRLLETSVDSDRNGSIDSDEQAILAAADEPLAHQIKRELRSLSSQGFEVKELGERRLKGLENPEYIYLMYPHALSGRLMVQQQPQAVPPNPADTATAHGEGQLVVDVSNVWDLCAVALRLEKLCNLLESPNPQDLIAPETAFMERIKEGGGEITDRFLLNIVEHQVSRIETCVNTLAIRNIVRPFGQGSRDSFKCSMRDVFAELASSMAELQVLRKQVAMTPMSTVTPSIRSGELGIIGSGSV